MSPEKELSDLISKRLLNVRHDDQDLTLEDSDWLMIINALSHYAMQEYEEEQDPSQRFGHALSVMPALALAAGCHIAMKVTEAKK